MTTTEINSLSRYLATRLRGVTGDADAMAVLIESWAWEELRSAAEAATLSVPGRWSSTSRTCASRDAVCDQLLRIMDTYHAQDGSTGGVDTPGGLEHMGDVWRLFRKWEAALK